MSTQDFLVELGTEELPPKALNQLSQSFCAGIVSGLESAGLPHAEVHAYAAPRRLAVLVKALATQQPDRVQNIDGPPVAAAFDADGNPTKAALGFARKNGVEVAELDNSGPKLRYVKEVKGHPARDLLPDIVAQSLNDLPIPKRMRWGARKTEFVRPSQWLVMLFGDEVIDCEILAQQAGRVSRGHRFHANHEVRISAPANYAEDLRSAYVIADFAERRAQIIATIKEAAAAHPFLRDNPPEIEWTGFMADGYVLENAAEPESALAGAHCTVTGESALPEDSWTALTDTRFYGLYHGIPSLCYGPIADSIHGFDEKVDLASVQRTTEVIALFIARWCGVRRLDG